MSDVIPVGFDTHTHTHIYLYIMASLMDIQNVNGSLNPFYVITLYPDFNKELAQPF